MQEEKGIEEKERQMNYSKIDKWNQIIDQYVKGERRPATFAKLLLTDLPSVEPCPSDLVILDIGCGAGFDDDPTLQHTLAKHASRYIGVEPDSHIELADIFHAVHNCRFEDAPIENNSIDIAFAVMVLEHIQEPSVFWEKIHDVLRPEGVFWGFTVDARHWFVAMSWIAERLTLKNLYLDFLHGRRGDPGRYANYPVYYRTNTPRKIRQIAKNFHELTFLQLHKTEQMDYYFPQQLRWIGRYFNRVAHVIGCPPILMAVRAKK
jgi:SAM-dependent methyltransferase